MKKLVIFVVGLLVSAGMCAQSKVYFTRDITPEALVRIYKALGKEAKGRVAVKISTAATTI